MVLGKLDTWNSKQPVFFACFNWVIPNHYIKNGCFTKHPLKKWLFRVPGITYDLLYPMSDP